MPDVQIVYLPSPPELNVFRDWAGGYGTALPSERDYPGHDQHYFDVPYLQFLYIARLLQADHISVEYENLQRHQRFEFTTFLDSLQRRTPKILITSLSLPSLSHDLMLLKQLKEQLPLKIVLIGSIAKLFKERILREGAADAVIIENEERITSEVVKELLRNSPSPRGAFFLRENNILGRQADLDMEDLNFVDFPAYDLLDFSQYESTYPFGKKMRYTTVFTSRGCPYPCQYCPYPVGFGKRVLYRSPEWILADLERLVKDFQVEFVVFRDQLLTLNRKHCEAIFQGIIEKKLPLIWLCETRYDLVDEALLRLMYAAGCREINYGLETGDETSFTAVGKAQAKKGLDYFGQVIQDTKAAGIRCHTHIMLGLPDDSWRSIKRTIRFLRKQKPDSVQVAIFIPYPGTPLGDQLKREGNLPHEKFEEYTGFKAVIPTKYLSAEEVDEAREYVYHVWDKTLFTRGINRLKRWVPHVHTKR